MPYSLRVKLGHLKHKGILTEKEYTRLINALDTENVLDDIKTEISTLAQFQTLEGQECVTVADVIECIDKHIGEKQ